MQRIATTRFTPAGAAPTDIEIAWAAGLFEGEGCFTRHACWLGEGPDRRRFYYPVATLQMGDKDVVLRFAEVMGMGFKLRERVPKKAHWKVMWEWRVYGRRRFGHVYGLLCPHLGDRRRTRGAELLDMKNDGTPGLGGVVYEKRCPRNHVASLQLQIPWPEPEPSRI
ncbi:MAG: hypothetical protein KGL39_55005 [Patescibacteria group bacterium]|nr:hypothetical protein [Patescibacteria group bacterium]